MTRDTITFQLGTHYLSRVALRMERLLCTIQEASRETHPVIHHAALNDLFELIKITEKPELKGRFLQEFMRIEHILNKSAGKVPKKLSDQIQILSQLVGHFGGDIHKDTFLSAIGLASTGHGNESEVHAPQLWFWLEGRADRRQSDLRHWLQQLEALESTIHVYLSLIRETASFERITPESGFYQCPLPHQAKTACQLILVRLSKEDNLIPKMQLGHHGLTLRLCEAKSMREVQDQNPEVELSICEL